jgi:hypothetical protein
MSGRSNALGAKDTAPTSTDVMIRPMTNALVRICVTISLRATSINPFTPRPP